MINTFYFTIKANQQYCCMTYEALQNDSTVDQFFVLLVNYSQLAKTILQQASVLGFDASDESKVAESAHVTSALADLPEIKSHVSLCHNSLFFLRLQQAYKDSKCSILLCMWRGLGSCLG